MKKVPGPREVGKRCMGHGPPEIQGSRSSGTPTVKVPAWGLWSRCPSWVPHRLLSTHVHTQRRETQYRWRRWNRHRPARKQASQQTRNRCKRRPGAGPKPRAGRLRKQAGDQGGEEIALEARGQLPARLRPQALRRLGAAPSPPAHPAGPQAAPTRRVCLSRACVLPH